MRILKVGIVGAAGRGRSFFSAFIHNPQTQLEALCDLNEEGIRQTAAEIGVSRVYTDCEEMLDKSGIDMVVIGTPMPLHVPQSVMALERGIHVISEVPAAISLEEARRLVQVCKKSSAKYMMAENYCYMRPNVLVREIARRGLFGTMYFGEGAYIHELKELNETTPWRRTWQTGIDGCTYSTHSLGPVYQWMRERVVSVSCTGSG
ncbi:MAG: Gfo/Idh/MocA family oxidoreductase, partial [bacterium]|nr:Gfo/Idh/MocA family oxidoreductase [bacterium]